VRAQGSPLGGWLRAFGIAAALAVAASASAQTTVALDEVWARLPPRLGVSLTIYNQNQPYDIRRLELSLPGIDLGQVRGLAIDNDTTTVHAMVDYWVLPFLDVFALAGTVDGTTTVRLSRLDLGLPIPLEDLRIDYDGTVWGGGLTAAYGGERAFGSLTWEYTSTDLDDGSSSEIEAWVATAKLGVHVEGGAVWTGLMYQSTDERHAGRYALPFFGEFDYRVEFEQRQGWNLVLGAEVGVADHWTVTFEGGAGDRRSAMMTLGYRF